MSDHKELRDACAAAIRALGDVCAVVNRSTPPAPAAGDDEVERAEVEALARSILETHFDGEQYAEIRGRMDRCIAAQDFESARVARDELRKLCNTPPDFYGTPEGPTPPDPRLMRLARYALSLRPSASNATIEEFAAFLDDQADGLDREYSDPCAIDHVKDSLRTEAKRLRSLFVASNASGGMA